METFIQGTTTYINANLDYFLPKDYDLTFAFHQNGNRLLYQAFLSDPQSPLKRVNEKNNAYFTCTLTPDITKKFVGNVELRVAIFKKDHTDEIVAKSHADLYFEPSVIQTKQTR